GASSSRTVTGRLPTAVSRSRKSSFWAAASSTRAAASSSASVASRYRTTRGGGPPARARGEQVPPPQRQPAAEELVLGTAQADALCAVPDRERRIPAVVRVRPDLEPPHAVRMPQQRFEITAGLRRDDMDGAGVDGAAAAVDRDELAFVQRLALRRHGPAGLVNP